MKKKMYQPGVGRYKASERITPASDQPINRRERKAMESQQRRELKRKRKMGA